MTSTNQKVTLKIESEVLNRVDKLCSAVEERLRTSLVPEQEKDAIDILLRRILEYNQEVDITIQKLYEALDIRPCQSVTR